MRILCVYYQNSNKHRNTIDEHLFSFRRYSNEECIYLNAALGVPRSITKIHFDLIIFHYTFTALKWDLDIFSNFQKKCAPLKYLEGYKIAIPQDEYVHSDSVNHFFKRFGIKSVFTCLPPSEYRKVYPESKSGIRHLFTVYAGYVDEINAEKYKSVAPLSQREIDIGYRVRKIPIWLGKHGQIKWELATRFMNEKLLDHFNHDISYEGNDVLLGKEWYHFLMRCRVVLGCEGGASMHDPTGDIRKKVEKYLLDHPDAEFNEVESACFPDKDGNLQLSALSPRHFECCITKTCQALVEGNYDGILKPGVHYIEIKKDWSNIPEVLSAIEDIEYCQYLADNAYRDIVESGHYTYRRFVERILEHIKLVAPMNETKFIDIMDLRILKKREKWNSYLVFGLNRYNNLRNLLRIVK